MIVPRIDGGEGIGLMMDSVYPSIRRSTPSFRMK